MASSKLGDKLTQVVFPYWVDVRDVAKAHIQALVTPAEKGERFVFSPHKKTYPGLVDVLRIRLGSNCSEERQELSCYRSESKTCEEMLDINR